MDRVYSLCLTLSVCLSSLQVSRLQQEVQQGENDIKTAEGQISTLKEAQDKLLEELDATRARLRETSNLLTALQVRQTKHTSAWALNFTTAYLTSNILMHGQTSR